MARFRDRLRIAAKAAVGVFSDASMQEAHGMLTGIWPGSAGAPPQRGARERVAAFADMPWLHAVADKVASAFASVEWELSVATPVKAPRAVRAKAIQRAGPVERRRALKALRDAGELTEIEEHPLLDILTNGNSLMTGLAVRRITSIHVDVEGEAFWLKERNGLGVPVGVWPLPPDWIRALPTPSTRAFRVGFRGWQGWIPDTEILPIVRHDPSNPYSRGAGLGRALADELETDEMAAKFCHDEATECLTRRGWVPGLDLRDDDEVATWNHELAAIEYQRPLGITRTRYVGPMHEWRGTFINACVTPTHRMWVYAGRGRGRGHEGFSWRFVESRELAAKSMANLSWRDAGLYGGRLKTVEIPGTPVRRRPGSRGGGRPPMYGVNDPLVFDAVAFAPFLGYYIAEGNLDKASVKISQASCGYVSEIRDALGIFPSAWVREVASRPALNGKTYYGWWIRHRGLTEWLRTNVFEGALNKRLPAEVFEWPIQAQRDLLTALINGDGSWRKTGNASFSSASEGLVDDVQRLCVQIGWSTTKSWPKDPGRVGHRNYGLGIQLTHKRRGGGECPAGITEVPRGSKRVAVVQYDGAVWCVTVPNERFFTRRNGRVMLGGNTRNTFFNQARPDFLVFPKVSEGEAPWSKPETERLQEQWRGEHQGFWRAFRPRFMSREVGVYEFGQTDMRHLQMVQLRQHERDTIIQVFGVPPELLGILESSNRACYSDDTECLTREGWRRHDVLTVDDEIATWNPHLERLEYERPSRVVRYPYTGPMHHWATRSVDVLVTPDHRMWVKTQFRGSYHVRRSDDLAGKKLQQRWRATGGGVEGLRKIVEIPFVANRHAAGRGYANPTPPIDAYRIDAHVFAEFLGYWLSEGSAAEGRGYAVNVFQNVGSKADKMRAAVEAIGFGVPRVSVRSGRYARIQITNKSLWTWLGTNCGIGSHHKRIPREAFSWPAAAQMTLLDALMLGDGSARPARTKTAAKFANQYYGTVSEQLANDVQQLCVQLGLRASVRRQSAKAGYEPGYVVGISSKQEVYVSTGAKKIYRPDQRGYVSPIMIEPYNGMVWCLEVPNHLFFTRRNGKVALHGNTIESADYLFSRWVLVPRLEAFRAVLQERLVPEYDERLILDYVSPVGDDKAFALDAARGAPWSISLDEWRAMQNLPPLEADRGRVFMVPLNLTPTSLDAGVDVGQMATADLLRLRARAG